MVSIRLESLQIFFINSAHSSIRYICDESFLPLRARVHELQAPHFTALLCLTHQKGYASIILYLLIYAKVSRGDISAYWYNVATFPLPRGHLSQERTD